MTDVTATPPEARRTGSHSFTKRFLRWLSPLSDLAAPLPICAMAYVSVAFLAYHETFTGLLAIYISKFAIALPLCILIILAVLAVTALTPSPIKFMIGIGRERAPRLTATVVLTILVITAFTTLKSNIPNLVPFYADPWIARAGLWLHGNQPWKIAHRLPDITGLLIDIVYSRVWFGLVLGTLMVAAVIEPSKRFRRLCSAFLATLIINGTILAIALSSVGPIFYHDFYSGQEFNGLNAAIASNPYINDVPLYADYLLESYRSGMALLGSGISAMPSVHVSLAVLTAWYLTSFGPVRGTIGWLLAALILLGSVYTGWHYALDGYLAILSTSLIWLAVSKFYRLPLGRATP
ncbi:phosphatase PAP2 family protein [Rhizobium halophytocola]|uniref:Inositolphosphotransferase Aur1/Ipt1 domain-containing protein n=1 Tax=Rhizobium halophytocola TaxID=735519 RepID=A0ABS4DXJ8_9HYPH|nr:phosphatase PAP2 family protein [Rhizobium halophytocola]MBP1850423.1 hypothetical protein [Rhizobium halophytocola]